MPVPLPPEVEVVVEDGVVEVKGPRGALRQELPARISVIRGDGEIRVERHGDDGGAKARHGLVRSLVSNMVVGVSTGFVKELEIQGVGFKAALKGGNIDLNLGYSHVISYPVPEGIRVKIDEGTRIRIEGADKQVVGRVAAEIRGFYPPEPYKGKGVRYKDEQVIRKEGKTVQ